MYLGITTVNILVFRWHENKNLPTEMLNNPESKWNTFWMKENTDILCIFNIFYIMNLAIMKFYIQRDIWILYVIYCEIITPEDT